MRFTFLLSLLALTVASTAHAADKPQFQLSIKDHKFNVEELSVPANTAFTLIVKNEDKSAEEFESHKMKVEKLIPANSESVIHVKPLKAGSYPFMGEFHESTAKGVIIAQ